MSSVTERIEQAKKRLREQEKGAAVSQPLAGRLAKAKEKYGGAEQASKWAHEVAEAADKSAKEQVRAAMQSATTDEEKPAKEPFTMMGTGEKPQSGGNVINALDFLKPNSSVKPSDLVTGKLTSVGAKAEHQVATKQAEAEEKVLSENLTELRAAQNAANMAANPATGEGIAKAAGYASLADLNKAVSVAEADLTNVNAARDAAAQNYYDLKGKDAVRDIVASGQNAAFQKAVELGVQIEELNQALKYVSGENATDLIAERGKLLREQKPYLEALSKAGYDAERAVGYEVQQSRAREAAKQNAATQEWADEHPVLSTIGSVVTSPVQGLDYFHAVTGNLGHNSTKDIESYKPLTEADFQVTGGTQALREGASADMGSVGKFLYNTGMSIVDSTLLVTTIGPAASVVLGMGAASNTAKDVIERGGTNNQALSAGLAAGAAEIIFEKVSIDNLLKIKNVSDAKVLVANVLKQAGTEASEEALTEISNILMDSVIMGENSSYEKAVRAYQKQGMSEEAAKQKAFLDNMAQIGLAAAGGALSGGVMGGGASVGSYAVSSAKQNELGRYLSDEQISILNVAKRFAEGSETRKLADAIANVNDAGNITSGQWGRLAQFMEAERDQYGPKLPGGTTDTTVEQVLHPDEKVMSRTAQAFMDAGDDAKTADIKSGVLDRVLAGDTTLTDGELRKLDLNSTSTRAVFKAATGTELPGVTDRKTLLAAARSVVNSVSSANEGIAAERANLQAQTEEVQAQNAKRVAEQEARVAAIEAELAKKASPESLKLSGGASITKAEFMEKYDKANPNAEAGAAEQSWSELQRLSKLRRDGAVDASYVPGAQQAATEVGAGAQVRSSVGTATPTANVAQTPVYEANRGTAKGLLDYVKAVHQNDADVRAETQSATVDALNVMLKRKNSRTRVTMKSMGKDGPNGDWSDDGSIVLNSDLLDTQGTIYYTLSHEFLHEASNRSGGEKGAWTKGIASQLMAFGEKLYNAAHAADPKKYKSWGDYKTSTYEAQLAQHIRNGMSLSDAKARLSEEYMNEEYAADVLREVFSSKRALSQMVRENRSAAIKLRDWLQDRFSDLLAGNVRADNATMRHMNDLVKKVNKALTDTDGSGKMEKNEAHQEVQTDGREESSDYRGRENSGRADRELPDRDAGSRVVQGGRMDGRGDLGQHDGQLIPEATRRIMNEKGIPDIGLRETQDRSAFSNALVAAKAANPNGGMVDSQTVEGLEQSGARMFMREDGLAGIAVETDGNIVGVFKHPDLKTPYAVYDLIYTALANGGTHLDCYATYGKNDLRNKYAQLGFRPVAYLEFNREYAAEDWSYEAWGEPDVVMWVHNGDSIEEMLTREEPYAVPTREVIHALEKFEDYDEAKAKQKSEIGKPDTRHSVSPDSVPDWDAQVSALLNGSFDELFWGDGRSRSAMYVLYEPTALLQELGLSDLPLVVTQKHAQDSLRDRWTDSGEVVDEGFHGITEAQFRRLPELIRHPVAVFRDDPKSNHPGGVNILTEEKDAKGSPIFVSINPDQPQFTWDKKSGPAHFVNVFGRQNAREFVSRAMESGDVLFVNKAKFDADPWLAPTAEPALSTADSIESGAIIGQKRPTVKPGERKFSVDGRPLADPLYSQMERVLNEYKGDRIGATSLVPYLKGRGVKDEEIKWSGIEQFLEGKKSVTKDELFEFLRANELVIEDVVLSNSNTGSLSRDEQEELDEVSKVAEENATKLYDLAEERGLADVVDEYKAAMMRGDGDEPIQQWFYRRVQDSIIRGIVKGLGDREPVPSTMELKNFAWVNDDFGFDSSKEAAEYIRRDPASFARNYEMSAEDKAMLLDYAEKQARNKAAKEAWEAENIAKYQDMLKLCQEGEEATKRRDHLKQDAYNRSKGIRPRYDRYAAEPSGGRVNYREVLFRLPEVGGNLDSPHWAQTDVLAHTRLQDMVDAEGKKVLFVDEVQSDWHQAGRDDGYTPKEMSDLLAERGKLQSRLKEAEDKMNAVPGGPEHDAEWKAARDEYDAALNSVESLNDRYYDLRAKYGYDTVPDAPYRDTWHEYVLKRVLRMAAEGGYDKVAWTTGQMQAERYRLNSQVESIYVNRDEAGAYTARVFYPGRTYPSEHEEMDAKAMHELFGHDLGDRLMKGIDAIEDADITGEAFVIEGEDLTIGGEGMKNFYDVGGKSSQNIPKFLNKYLKPWGVKVQSSLVGEDLTGSSAYRNGGMEEVMRIYQSGMHHMDNLWLVPGVDITDQMRDDLLYKGQPRYSVGGLNSDTPGGMMGAGLARTTKAAARKEAQLAIAGLPEEDRKVVTAARQRANYARSIATMTDSRLDKVYGECSYPTLARRAKGYLAYIDPYDFLMLTTSSAQDFLSRNTNELNEGVSEWGDENNIQESGPLYLRIDDTGRVVGHEGRHRMAALHRAGVERVAVVISTDPVDDAKPISIKELTGQDFGDTRSYSSVYVHNLIPVSKEYEAVNRYVFGGVSGDNSLADPNIRYSVDPSDVKGSVAEMLTQLMEAGELDYALKRAADYIDAVRELRAATDEQERNARALNVLRPKVKWTDEYLAKQEAEVSALIEKYGELERTSGDAHNVSIPAQIDDETYTRSTVNTFINNDPATSDAVKNELIRGVLDGSSGFVYEKVTDKATLEKVNEEYEAKDGPKNMKAAWENAIATGALLSKEDIARGAKLFHEACVENRVDDAVQLAAELSAAATQMGQAIQGLSLVKKMTTHGKLYYLEQSTKRLNRDLKKRHGDKHVPIVLNTSLVKKMLAAKTQADIEATYDALLDDLAKQVPVNVWDKWNAWRYLAMLGNAKTQFKNIIGNATFVPIRATKDLLAATVELALPQSKRTKTFKSDKALREFAMQDAVGMRDILTNTGKYDDRQAILRRRDTFRNSSGALRDKLGLENRSAQIKQKMQDKLAAEPDKDGFIRNMREHVAENLDRGVLNFWSRSVSDLMEEADWSVGDLFGLKVAYANALSKFLTARGVTIEDVQGAETNAEGRKILKEAREYAVREAQKATYRDASAVARWLNNAKQSARSKAGTKPLAVMMDAVLPFTTTPINIMKRGIEYSPIGVLDGILKMTAGVKSGKYTAAEGIDRLCSGVAGSVAAALGYLLAKWGMAIGSLGDDDEDEAKKQQGYQEYSLQIGDTSYTIEWAAPVSMPFFIGVDFYNAIRKEYDGDFMGTALDVLSNICEPMLSMSVLNSLDDTLTSIKYAEGAEKALNLTGTLATNYLSQIIPTSLGQVTRTVDESRRTAFTKKGEATTVALLKRFWQNSVLGKSVFWSGERMRWVDNWGRTDTTGSAALRAFENLVSPGYINTVNVTPVDAEVARLAESTGDKSVFPNKASKYFSMGEGKEHVMTQEEYERHLIDRGQTSFQLVDQIINDPMYDDLNDATRAEAITLAYKYASEMAKIHTNEAYVSKAEKYARWVLTLSGLEASGVDAAEYLILKARKAISGDDIDQLVLGANWGIAGTETYIAENASSQRSVSNFTDPYMSGYEYTLDKNQQAQYTSIWDRLFHEEFSELYTSDEYRDASAEEREALVSNVRKSVTADAEREMADWLWEKGVESKLK